MDDLCVHGVWQQQVLGWSGVRIFTFCDFSLCQKDLGQVKRLSWLKPRKPDDDDAYAPVSDLCLELVSSPTLGIEILIFIILNNTTEAYLLLQGLDPVDIL